MNKANPEVGIAVDFENALDNETRIERLIEANKKLQVRLQSVDEILEDKNDLIREQRTRINDLHDELVHEAIHTKVYKDLVLEVLRGQPKE